jgi:hypothetical protein
MTTDSKAAGDALVAKIEQYAATTGVSFNAAMRDVLNDPANRDLARTWSGMASPAGDRGQDAGEIVVSRAEALCAKGHVTFADAVRQTLQADPALAKCYGEGSRYAGRPADRPRHYSELSPDEQRRHLPLRRLQPGEPIDPARTYLMRMTTPDLGGGRFEVLGA